MKPSYRLCLSIVSNLYIGSICPAGVSFARRSFKRRSRLVAKSCRGFPSRRLKLSPTSRTDIHIVSGGNMSEEKNKKTMTTDAGRPVGDNQNSLTVGPRGPVVYEDFLLFEKMAHFNRERIPERV